MAGMYLAVRAVVSLCAVGVAFGAQTIAAAQTPADTLRLRDAVALAREANPTLQAQRWRAEAARAGVPRAGALPDPQLSFGVMNRMVGDLGSTMEPMTMNTVELSQMFPWPGTLGFAERRAHHLARAEALSADDEEFALIARVKSVYFELAYMDRALEIMEATRNLLRDFLDVSEAMYGVGSGLQQDVLQAQVGVARMTEDITVMRQRRLAMAARLNALLGREATDRVGLLELPPAIDDLPDADSLMRTAAARRPALAAAQERVQAAEAGYRAARRELNPDVMVGISYGQRPQYPDMASLILGFRVPLWAGSRQLPMREEMRAMKSMAEAEARDLYNETYAMLVELRSEAERSRNLSQLYAHAIVPQARASVDAAFAAYRVGRVDYMTLVNNEMTVNRYEIESVRLTADYHRAVAQMHALIGWDGGVR